MSAAVPWYFLPQFRPARLQDCVLWLESDSFSGGIWRNLAPNYSDRNHGTAHGGVGLTPWHSQFSPAPTFYGDDEYVEVPNSDSLDIYGINNPLSLEAWVKSYLSSDKLAVLIHKGTYPTYEYRFFIEYLKIDFVVNENGVFHRVQDPNPVDSNLHHWVGVYNTTHLLLYKDGSLVNSVSHSGVVEQNTYNLIIGHYGPGSYWFNGIIPLVRVYKGSLSHTEIRHNYTHHPLYYLQRGIDPYEVIAAATAAATPSI